MKKFRLEEAVVACKSGKMSQAAASVYYHIPKTTIWRRLQQDNKKMKMKPESCDPLSIVQDNVDAEPEFTFCEVFRFILYLCTFFLYTIFGKREFNQNLSYR